MAIFFFFCVENTIYLLHHLLYGPTVLVVGLSVVSRIRVFMATKFYKWHFFSPVRFIKEPKKL